MNPVKYLIKDVENKPTPLHVWLQGTLKRIMGNFVIISDSTGEINVTGGELKNLNIGDYCCVIGIAVNMNDLLEIRAAKFIKISSTHQQSWELEVKESQLVLQGTAAPKL